MSFDQNNDYSAGGPGAKRRRERLTVASIPKRIAKPKPYLRKPTNEKRKGSNDEMSDGYRGVRGVKQRIRHLVLDHDMGFLVRRKRKEAEAETRASDWVNHR